MAAVGFLEESAGVRSSTRLLGAVLAALAALVTVSIVVYVFKFGKDASAEVVAAMTGALTALVAQGCVAIAKRHAAPDPADG